MREPEAASERRDRDNTDELIGRIAQVISEDGTVDAMEGLALTRLSNPTEKLCWSTQPSFCVIAQGAKEVYVGDGCYPYDAEHYLLTTVQLPVSGRIVEASKERPYLGLRLDLDAALVGSVMVEAGLPVPHSQSEARALTVSPLDAELLDATVRLMRLVDSPAQAAVLAPLVKREIVYRLLVGEQGHRLQHLPLLGSHSHSIAQAIDLLQQDFDQPLSIAALARKLGMSVSGLHHHFRTITNMSPLQFQKQLRLQEARRLMLWESLDAASAAFKVGYGDASHFSRDYKKHFGVPPATDAGRLRRSAQAIPA